MEQTIDNNVWTVDGPNVVFAGAPMHTRMTVVRLQDERLWIHSPIALSAEVVGLIERLGGEVAALIAPNKYHYLFVDAWRIKYPQAELFAESDLLKKVPSLAGAHVLSDTPPPLYSQDIEQVVFRANRFFQEVVFFHKASESLILTDLMINLPLKGIGLLPRLFLKFEGVTYPNGGVARLNRWLCTDKTKVRHALAVIRSWKPARLLFCHGEPFDLSAMAMLDQEFKYLD